METFLHLANGGVGNLAAYLAAHVLLCLLPACFIAGAMAALIPKASITRWLGRSVPGHVSYPAAAAAGSLLAVCSCTIVPLFAGIYKKGAGLGPAITFLFFAPAGNVLALAYTGSILGPEFAFARLALCLLALRRWHRGRVCQGHRHDGHHEVRPAGHAGPRHRRETGQQRAHPDTGGSQAMDERLMRLAGLAHNGAIATRGEDR